MSERVAISSARVRVDSTHRNIVAAVTIVSGSRPAALTISRIRATFVVYSATLGYEVSQPVPHFATRCHAGSVSPVIQMRRSWGFGYMTAPLNFTYGPS